MRPDNLGFPIIMPPADPLDQNNLVQVERWKGANKRYEKLVEQTGGEPKAGLCDRVGSVLAHRSGSGKGQRNYHGNQH